MTRHHEWDDATTMVPHTGVASLITTVLDVDSDGITCEGVVHEDSPFADRGVWPSFVGLELAAQAGAVLEALEERDSAGRAHGRIGYLVRARHVRTTRPRLAAGRPVTVRLTREARAGPLRVYSTILSMDGVEFLRGTISTYEERFTST